jgi:hypothetical protein
LDQEFLLELQAVEHVINKVETQHLEHQDNLFIWLHTVEDQHKVTDSLVQTAQEPIIEQELVQAEAVKVTGLTHGAQAVAEAEQVEQENIHMLKSLTQEDTQDTTVEVEMLQKDHQAEAQDGQTQMILLIVQQVDAEAQVFTELQAVAEVLAEVLVEQVQQAAEMAMEITLELKELTRWKTLVQAVAVAEETQAERESVKLPIG